MTALRFPHRMCMGLLPSPERQTTEEPDQIPLDSEQGGV